MKLRKIKFNYHKKVKTIIKRFLAKDLNISFICITIDRVLVTSNKARV